MELLLRSQGEGKRGSAPRGPRFTSGSRPGRVLWGALHGTNECPPLLITEKGLVARRSP